MYFFILSSCCKKLIPNRCKDLISKYGVGAKVLWAYLTLIWLCFVDEGTDIYGAYQHFL